MSLKQRTIAFWLIAASLLYAATTGPLDITGIGHLTGFGSTPTITAHFNTSGDSVAGKDAAGRITVGSGAATSTGTIDFATAWSNAPTCFAQTPTNVDGHGTRADASTTQLVLTHFIYASGTAQNFGNGDIVTYICLGWQ